MRSTSAKKVALCGVFGAFSVLLLCMGSIVPFATFACPAFAGILILPVAIELGQGAGWLLYTGVSLLSLVLVADKEMAFVFIFLLGYYPLLKAVLQRIKPKALAYAAKLLVFNAAVFGMYGIMLYLFPISYVVEEFASYGTWYIVLLVVLANIVFLVYDAALERFASLYITKFRSKLMK